MATVAPKFYEPHEYVPTPTTKHVHHGRTTACWTGSMIALVAFIVGGVGLMMMSWPVFWTGVGLVAVSLIATQLLRSMGKGAD